MGQFISCWVYSIDWDRVTNRPDISENLLICWCQAHLRQWFFSFYYNMGFSRVIHQNLRLKGRLQVIYSSDQPIILIKLALLAVRPQTQLQIRGIICLADDRLFKRNFCNFSPHYSKRLKIGYLEALRTV